MTGPTVQDLGGFRLPSGFRGRSVWVVQLWRLTQVTLFAGSPQFMYGWRRGLLRLFGARIGQGARIRPSVRIAFPWRLTVGDHSWIGDDADLYTLDTIRIGRNAVVSQYAHLCTGGHDISAPAFDIVTAPILVEDEAWICAGVFVHPGVTIGRGSVVAARSVVRRSVAPHGLYAGDPLRRVSDRRPDAAAGRTSSAPARP